MAAARCGELLEHRLLLRLSAANSAPQTAPFPHLEQLSLPLALRLHQILNLTLELQPFDDARRRRLERRLLRAPRDVSRLACRRQLRAVAACLASAAARADAAASRRAALSAAARASASWAQRAGAARCASAAPSAAPRRRARRNALRGAATRRRRRSSQTHGAIASTQRASNGWTGDGCSASARSSCIASVPRSSREPRRLLTSAASAEASRRRA